MKVLFLCTGNSCRSQIAEAVVNYYLADQWLAFSAGTNPAGFVHPLTIEVLSEIGIDHSGVSKNVDQFKGQSFDLVMTVCDQAAENCPVWLGSGKKLHIGFADPAKAVGTPDEIMNAYRRTRDEIRLKVINALLHY